LVDLFTELDGGFGLKVSTLADHLGYCRRKIGRVLKNSKKFREVATRRYKLNGVEK